MQLRHWIPARTFKGQLANESVNGLNVQQQAVSKEKFAEKADLLFRIVVVGEAGVGKSSMVYTFLRNGSHKAESSRKLKMHSDSLIKLEIYEPTSISHWCADNVKYQGNVIGAVILYDISRRETFEKIQAWYNTLRQNFHSHGCHEALQLVGCKSDLAATIRQVDVAEAQYWANLNGLSHYETSSATGANIELAFLDIADKMLQKLEAGDVVNNPKSTRLRFTSSMRRIEAHPYITQIYKAALETMSVAQAEQIKSNTSEWAKNVCMPIEFKLHNDEAIDIQVMEQKENPFWMPSTPLFPPPGRRHRRFTDMPQFAKGHEPWKKEGAVIPDGEVDEQGRPWGYHLWTEYVPNLSVESEASSPIFDTDSAISE